jgi:hypothetical protein
VTALRWIGRSVFVVSLLIWVTLALQAVHGPESGRAAQRRTGAFVVMVASGMLSFPAGKQSRRDEEEY